jgi:hypothetical protein
MTQKFEITDDQNALDSCQYVVCLRASGPGYFPDDQFGFCCQCDEKVRHRPHIPIGPKLICVPCAQPMMARNPVGLVSTRSMEEVASFRDLHKKGRSS